MCVTDMGVSDKQTKEPAHDNKQTRAWMAIDRSTLNPVGSSLIDDWLKCLRHCYLIWCFVNIKNKNPKLKHFLVKTCFITIKTLLSNLVGQPQK